MDTKIENGDLKLNSCGMPISISGFEEILQQAYICLTVPKGEYPYNRELGSKLKELDLTAEHAQEEAVSLANEAFMSLAGVFAQSVEIKGNELIFCVDTPSGSGKVTINLKQGAE